MNGRPPRISLPILLLSTLLLQACPSPEPDLPQETPLTQGERAVLEQVRLMHAVAAEQGEQIWPGYRPDRVPFLVYRPHGRSFLVNPHPTPHDLEPVHLRGFAAPLYAVPSDRLEVSPNTPFARDFPVAGGRAFLVRHRTRDNDENWFRLAVHELFHDYQHGHFQRPDFPDACRYPYDSAENAWLARVEEELLVILLLQLVTDAEPDPLDYVAVRLARYGLAQSGEAATAIEEWEELTEGTARYVEESYAAVAGYTTLREVQGELASYFRTFRPKDLQKWKYYRTGTALALLLDSLSLHRDWTAAAETGKGPFPVLQETLRKAVTAAGADRVSTVLSRFGEERERVAAAMEKYLEKERTTVAKWREQGAWQVDLDFPLRGTAYYSNRGLTFQLPDCSRLASGIISFVDRRYKLEVARRGVAIRQQEPGYSLRFYHDLDGGTVLVDGRPWSVPSGTTPFARTLAVTFDGFQLNLTGEGEIVVQENRVTFTVSSIHPTN